MHKQAASPASRHAERSDASAVAFLRFRAKDKSVYYVYILASRSRTLYIGVTGNIDRRLAEHRQKLIPGFTARYNISRIVHLERYTNVRIAIQREKELKGWTRAKKITLIEQDNPTWQDLASEWGKADPSLRSG